MDGKVQGVCQPAIRASFRVVCTCWASFRVVCICCTIVWSTREDSWDISSADCKIKHVLFLTRVKPK